MTKKNIRQVIVVSGLPRSGTSLMMQMLDAGGLPVLCDGCRGPDEDNPKGYYEFERVKRLREGDTAWLEDAIGKAVKVVTAHLKHLPKNYAYRLIHMHRPLEEILASQKKMLINRGEDTNVSDDEMQHIFTRHLQEIRSWLVKQSNFEFMEADFRSAVESPEPVVNKVCDFLELDLDRPRMIEVVRPELYRNRES